MQLIRSIWLARLLAFGVAIGLMNFPAAGEQIDLRSSWETNRKTPPQGAPNIVIILLDDVGFGAASAFGGPINTPTFDKLAETGVRYNRFHTTSVCSPTRAALLTGRNAHRVNAGVASGNERDQVGYNGMWPRSTVSIADVLRRNGYSTSVFGKWHNTPNWETSPVGPFDRWPTGLGFEHFYGFMAGEASQWRPILYRNTSVVTPPATEDYHFSSDIADEAVGWLHTHQALAPEKPYLLYFAPGAAHAPHHVPSAWIDKYRGRFDAGWDQMRERIFERQKQLGVIPSDARLTPRPEELPSWSSLSDNERKLFARQMEVFAGFLEHADHEIGRVVEAARDGPGGENTLVIYIMGDNGASAEGGMHGSDRNIADIFYGLGAADVDTQLARADELGGPLWDNHFAVPWAWALDTPFQWMKQTASHLGGTRNPMVINWPGKISRPGAVRHDWTHVVDIVPTIYSLVGIEPPTEIDGVPQKSIDGVDFSASFLNDGPAITDRTQYFEMFGNRAIYKDGWMASARHSLPWKLLDRDPSLNDDKWELYNIEDDFSQSIDLASRYPERLRELQQLFLREAERNDVLPMFTGLDAGGRKPSLTAGRNEFIYRRSTSPVPSLSGAPMLLGPHTIEVEVTVPEGGANGVLVANGASEGGFALYFDSGFLVYENNYGGRRWDVVRSSETVEPGPQILRVELTEAGPSLSASLFVQDRPVGMATVPSIAPPSYLGAFCVGRNCGTPVGRGYVGEFPFEGRIEKVTVRVP